MTTDFIDTVFGPGGYIAKASKGYERRAGQVQFAQSVDDAISAGEHLFAEVPCGGGKSYGYCIPAIRHAVENKRRIVIATAGIGLQEQLAHKDLPFLARALPWKFTFSLLKGRSNYLCAKRQEEANETGLPASDLELFREVNAWAETTRTGDVSELPIIPAQNLWSRFAVKSEECLRKDCPAFGRCHFERAKAEAHASNIIVTNYHLLFASMMIKNITGEHHLLPPFDVVIMDEAHEAADVARDFFGFSVSDFAFKRIRKAAVRLGMTSSAAEIGEEATRLWFALRELAEVDEMKGRLREPVDFDTEPLRAAVEPVIARLRNHADGTYAAETLDRVDEWLTQSDSNRVYWLEQGERGYLGLKSKYIDVGPVLSRELFGAAKSVIACSATLSVGGSFSFSRSELGAPAAVREVNVPSPFDFRRQAKLIVPRNVPEPRDPAFPKMVAESLESVVRGCDGRTLGLFTSYKNLNVAYEHLRPRIGGRYRLLRQGDAPKSELTRIFREDIHSVLLATERFWTGIDIPGQALTGLVIDKLPFPSPDDPVADALSSRSSDSFARYTIPKTTLLLKQGVGRLIRSVNDVGVVVILDARLVKKSYGQRILRALPDMPLGTTLADVDAFMRVKERAA